MELHPEGLPFRQILTLVAISPLVILLDVPKREKIRRDCCHEDWIDRGYKRKSLICKHSCTSSKVAPVTLIMMRRPLSSYTASSSSVSKRANCKNIMFSLLSLGVGWQMTRTDKFAYIPFCVSDTPALQYRILKAFKWQTDFLVILALAVVSTTAVVSMHRLASIAAANAMIPTQSIQWQKAKSDDMHALWASLNQ